MKKQKNKVTLKPSVSSKINKKKHGYNTKRTWGLSSNITTEKLDNLNEIIREHKAQLADGKGTWKLVPKDSCEVYKERRKRKMERRKRSEDRERENEDDTRGRRRVVRWRQSNRRNRRKYTRRTTNRKRVQPSESSIASGDCDCGCHCGSPSSSSTSTARSSVTISDMECD